MGNNNDCCAPRVDAMGNIQKCCSPKIDCYAKCLWDQDTVDPTTFDIKTLILLKKDLLAYIGSSVSFDHYLENCKRTKYEIPKLVTKLRKLGKVSLPPAKKTKVPGDKDADKELNSEMRTYKKELYKALRTQNEFVRQRRQEFIFYREKTIAKISAMDDEVETKEETQKKKDYCGVKTDV